MKNNMSLKLIEKLQWENLDEVKVKINELIEVVNEQSKMIEKQSKIIHKLSGLPEGVEYDL